MIKNIKTNKISHAAKAKSACKTYRGAKIEEIDQHFENEWSEDNTNFHGVIVHAGTNNLAQETAEEAASKIEKMIIKFKSKATHVAISSVTERFDHKVAASKISKFNSLLSNLCDNHKIDFINNSNITKKNVK